MSINIVERIDDQVKVSNALVSVSDKSGLDAFIPELIAVNPGIRILSTGGTYAHIQKLLGNSASKNLIQVSEYTGQPETQGGLVKTLDFKIYLGLLTETYNPSHAADMQRTGAVAIDMVVVNLYPFEKTVADPEVTVEQARGNIDIGGPCMIRAAAKNFHRVASVVDPSDYREIIAEMKAAHGATSLELRFRLARKAFAHTARYDQAIAGFLASRPINAVRSCYRF